MLQRRGFLTAMLGILAGCGRPPEPAVPKSVTLTTDGHLTEHDVRVFLEIVSRLPGQKPPAFQPASELDLSFATGAQSLVDRWQAEFRSSSSPQTQARFWKRDTGVRSALSDCGVAPEEFASLLVRLSAAVVRESVDPNVDLAAFGEQADRTIASLCSEFDGLDRNPRLSPSVRNARADLLSAMLKEAVAYREFLRILESISAESVAAVARHRDVLRPLMPATESTLAFEKKLQSQSQILRASHELPARPSTPKKR
ncbi:hypothetical protein Pan44_11510 [Caulifigura coniformis]|uniref:Uncharacterized protein n=1 Tax=Caulifigura coniformis TaxID=2527983 RepID=A0A517SAM8_9PLAN|nr:hypothetical protein [Caulifigura coniformis]QDT53136.1 hypothetical protein Pan44_11510 [Caulifigura coniformis]